MCRTNAAHNDVTKAYINRLATAVPEHEVHGTFVNFAERLLRDRRMRQVFERMVARSDIERRWSCLKPANSGSNESLDADGFYTLGQFPSTAHRMSRYALEAPALGAKAIAGLRLGADVERISHLIVTSCTGFSAPGIDVDLVRRCGLDPCVERTVVGFMGCNAAINGLRLADHIVRSTPSSKVLLVSVELCTLHLQETDKLDRLLAFLLFGDGCSAALVSAEPTGLAVEGFHAELVHGGGGQITWNIGDCGFDMVLSGQVPTTIGEALRIRKGRILSGVSVDAIDLWAVHPGGRTVLDAVEGALDLNATALAASRDVLREHGNMSSATVLFVLEALMRRGAPVGARGCAMAFGPGLSAETMMFSKGA